MTLTEVVAVELTKMLARQLDYSPAAEDLPLIIQVMVEDLRRVGLSDYDAERVQAAFGAIATNVGRWPTMYMVREHLPGRQHTHKELPAPAPRGITEHLKELGLDQKPGESIAEQAARCRQWLLENMSSGANPSFVVPKHIVAQFEEWPEEQTKEVL